MPAGRSICDTRITEPPLNAQAGFQPKEPNIQKGEPTYLPESELEWGGNKPRPTASDTILPEQGKQLTISCEVAWTNLRIDVKTNLIDKILESMQTLIDAGVGVMSNENTAIQAIQQVTSTLRSILEGSRREISQPWRFKFISDYSSPYVFVSHNQSYTTYVSQVGVVGSSFDMSVQGETEVRLNGRLVDEIKLTFTRDLAETQPRELQQKCTAVALHGSEHIVSIETKLTLNFTGFRRTIEELIGDLTQMIQSLASGGILMSRLWEELKKIGTADDPVAEAERSLAKFREELTKALKDSLQRMINLLTQFQGHVIIKLSAITLTAITEQTFIEIDNRLHGGTPTDGPAPSNGEAVPSDGEIPMQEESGLKTEPRNQKSGSAGTLKPPARVAFALPAEGLKEAMMVHYDPIFPNKSLVVLPVALHRKLVTRKD